MRSKTMVLVLAALAGLPAVGRTGGPRRAGASDAPPFLCYADVWQGAFEVSAPHYDDKRGRITWELRAKKKVRPSRYEASLTDADGIQRAVIPVALGPEREEYAKGEKVRAVVTLPRPHADLELARLVIRAAGSR